MSPRAREISVGTEMYLRHRRFRNVKVNGLNTEGEPPRALHRKVPKI